jgi:hypothetical protein
VTRFAYTILALLFIASVVCSTYALVQVKTLQSRRYHVYTGAEIDLVETESRHWMMLGVFALAAAILTFIPLMILPALGRLGRAIKDDARQASTRNDSGERPLQ